MMNQQQRTEERMSKVYYDKTQDKPIVKGMYPAHIKDIDSREAETKFGTATVVELRVSMGLENELKKVKVVIDGKEETAEYLFDKEFVSKGIFLYTDTDKSGLNRNYLRFCKTFAIEGEEEEVEGKMMTALPNLVEDASIIKGEPVIVSLEKEYWKTREGEDRRTWKAMTVVPRQGKKRNFDVPF